MSKKINELYVEVEDPSPLLITSSVPYLGGLQAQRPCTYRCGFSSGLGIMTAVESPSLKVAVVGGGLVRQSTNLNRKLAFNYT